MRSKYLQLMTVFAVGAMVALAALPGLESTARGSTVTMDFDIEFSGGQAPGGATPWLTAVFDDAADSIGANGVLLTLSTPGLTGSENIDKWLFNLNPALDPTQLTFTRVGGTGPVSVTIATTADNTNSIPGDGGGYYDINFNFPQGNPAGRFSAGETEIYEIGYVSPLTADDFNFLAAPHGGNGVHLSAAHVQNTTGEGSGGSGWVAPGNGTQPIPEPATLVIWSLLGLGFACGGWARRKRSEA